MSKLKQGCRLVPTAFGMAPLNRDEYNQAEFDSVYKPKHYADKEIEPICYIRSTLTVEEFVGYCIGNVLKYVSRWRKKGGLEDLKKADTYMMWAVKAVENEGAGNEKN